MDIPYAHTVSIGDYTDGLTRPFSGCPPIPFRAVAGRPGHRWPSAPLDRLIGTWTAEETIEMDRALEHLSRIDEAMWK